MRGDEGSFPQILCAYCPHPALYATFSRWGEEGGSRTPITRQHPQQPHHHLEAAQSARGGRAHFEAGIHLLKQALGDR